MTATIEQNKAIVRRFNKEIIEEGNTERFHELVSHTFINHTAAKGVDNGPAGLIHTFEHILRPAFSALKVTIYDQVGEGDKVTTRKTICGIHTGSFMGVEATHQSVTIHVMDMVTIKDGKYHEHWGVNTMMAVAAELKALHTAGK